MGTEPRAGTPGQGTPGWRGGPDARDWGSWEQSPLAPSWSVFQTKREEATAKGLTGSRWRPGARPQQPCSRRPSCKPPSLLWAPARCPCAWEWLLSVCPPSGARWQQQEPLTPGAAPRDALTTMGPSHPRSPSPAVSRCCGLGSRVLLEGHKGRNVPSCPATWATTLGAPWGLYGRPQHTSCPCPGWLP